MKRVTYISKFSYALSSLEIVAIGEISRRNNKRNEITGFLVCYSDFFFQVIEGNEVQVDNLYTKILTDPRHTDILCLKTETQISERLFPDWSMKTIDLNQNTFSLIEPIKTLLQTLTESHRIIEKYTQKSVIRMIQQGVNPLHIAPRMVEKIVFFGDLMAFSTFTEKLPVQEVVAMINEYFTICTQIIGARGGEVTKFVGDCVMAYFDVDQGDDAISASLEILAALETLRKNAPPDSPLKMMYSGIGLSKGTVIEGNIGTALKKEYTIIGDAVNVAERLESLTRDIPYFLAFSLEVKETLTEDKNIIEVGNFNPKGKEEILSFYTVEDPVTYKGDKQLSEVIKSYLNNLNT